MALEDMEKTSYITPLGTNCYKVMPFGLKNADATYNKQPPLYRMIRSTKK